jgi:protein TonB
MDGSLDAPSFDRIPIVASGIYDPRITGVFDGLLAPPPQPVEAPQVVAAPPPAGPVPVSSGVQAAKLIKRVIPPYPALARQTRTSGTVKLLAIIGKDGAIRTLDVIEGHPLLRQAAVDAVRQWVYSPTILSGQPVEVQVEIEVNFTLR